MWCRWRGRGVRHHRRDRAPRPRSVRPSTCREAKPATSPTTPSTTRGLQVGQSRDERALAPRNELVMPPRRGTPLRCRLEVPRGRFTGKIIGQTIRTTSSLAERRCTTSTRERLPKKDTMAIGPHSIKGRLSRGGAAHRCARHARTAQRRASRNEHHRRGAMANSLSTEEGTKIQPTHAASSVGRAACARAPARAATRTGKAS